MPAPHASEPTANNSNSTSGRSTGSLFDFLFALFSQSPPWVRTVVVLAVFTGAAFGVYRWLASGRTDSSKSDTQSNAQQPVAPAYPLAKGTQVNGPNNANNDPANVAATQRIADDAEHYKWHATHEQHEPDWNIISKLDQANLVEYKYYKDTDRCILLWRIEDGNGEPQWIHDPIFAKTAVGTQQERSAPGMLLATALASPQEFAPGPKSSPVQVGCANPHPGAFQWWWGAPVDQCWTPMYRKFGDQCTHHQMFNRCYNVWDPNIYWDFCTGAPQHY